MTDFTPLDVLESLKDPFVFCGCDHVIRFMNRSALERYADRPAAVGRSIFDCHDDVSNDRIRELFARLAAGEDEALVSEDARKRTFMRAVRSAEGELLGYYERYEARA